MNLTPYTLNLSCIPYPFPASQEGVFIQQIIAAIRAEKVFIFPTETFYGLGGNALSQQVVERVRELKNRPDNKAFPILVSNCQMLESLVENIPDEAMTLMNRHWPGPLTIIFSARQGLPAGTVSPEQKIAVRISSHPFLRLLSKKLSLPMIATSANLSSAPAAKSWTELDRKLLQKVDFCVDGGNCPPGLASTVIDITVSPPKVIRSGDISLEQEQS
ncbi:MAG: L-threonylcarbamoyladenylate synthase [Pseudomonadota bacterium]|nr:L-threonylcarbamoyladenylate synthase [Pseudomonadota bacterium]